EVSKLCDYIVLNSLSHWKLYAKQLSQRASLGLRINPGLSFVEDPRYDPCREHSKLGVSLRQLTETYKQSPEALTGLEGLHFHSNCDSTFAKDLASTIQLIREEAPVLLREIRWLNLGGGYLLQHFEDPDAFRESVRTIKNEFDI